MTNDCGKSEQKRTYLVLMLLDMVLDTRELPPRALVDTLEVAEQQQITRWCRAMHIDASTDPEYLEAHPDEKCGPAPECLRRILPKHHAMQTWRMPPAPVAP